MKSRSKGDEPMAVDIPVLAQRGAALRLQQIADEIADLQTFIVNGHAAPPYLQALDAFNRSNLRATVPAPRQAGELELEVEAHRPRQKKRPPQTVIAKAARRRETAAFLDTFTKHPISIADLRKAGIIGRTRSVIAALVRHGYLRKRGDTFHRRRKPFLVDPAGA
jgi:hypothetical protein